MTNCQKIIKSKNYQLVIQTKIKNQCISIGVLLLKTRWSKRLSFASNDRKSCQPMKFLDFVCSISGEPLDRFSSFFDTKSHSMKQCDSFSLRHLGVLRLAQTCPILLVFARELYVTRIQLEMAINKILNCF